MSGIPKGATEQLLYVKKAADGALTTEAMACFMIRGRIEQMYLSGTTRPWTPTDDWELKSILDLKTMMVLDPKTRIPVGRCAAGGRFEPFQTTELKQ
jgi:hypothetical protein